MRATQGHFRSRESRIHTKTSLLLPVGKRYLPIGKRVEVATANEKFSIVRLSLVFTSDANTSTSTGISSFSNENKGRHKHQN